MEYGFIARALQVMIASPGDVDQKRQSVREEIVNFNGMHSEKEKIVLLPVGWETHSYPETGADAQTILNKQIVSKCDLLVGIFGTKVGTKTENALSGTIEEINEHINAGKPAMIYFSTELVPRNTDQDQLKKLENFKKELQLNKGEFKALYKDFNSTDDFRNKFRNDLYRMVVLSEYFNESKISNLSEKEIIEELKSNKGEKEEKKISEEAKELIAEAYRTDSEIHNFSTMEGQIIQAGEKGFTPVNPRDDAYYVEAINELESKGYIRSLNSKRQVFKLTREGYKYGDENFVN